MDENCSADDIVNWRDDEGNGYLHLSVRNDAVEEVRFLLELGCDVNLENSMRETPLVWANFDNPRMVEMLLSAGANVYKRNRIYIPEPVTPGRYSAKPRIGQTDTKGLARLQYHAIFETCHRTRID